MATGSVGSSTPNAIRLMAELEFLNELCAVVASNTELQPILDWIVQKTTGMFRAEEGSIRLLGAEAGVPTARTLIRKEAPGISSGSWPAAIATNVMGYLMHKGGEPLATEDLVNDPRFPGLRGADTRIRSALAVPLRVENQITGMLAVTHSTPGRAWKSDEVQLLSIVAANSANVIERARLRVEALEKQRLEEEQRRMDRELNLARDIQMNLVPSAPLRLGAWEVSGRVLPARQVGGDGYDYFPLGEHGLALAIADVAGKGVPAALMMSNIQASLRAFCNGRGNILDAIRHVNQSVLRTATVGKFVTLFYGEFDASSGLLRYTNAGHNYPLVRRRDGELIELRAGGLPLGIAELPYEQGEVLLGPGDSLLLYSDGIPEAFDAFQREFGDQRLRQVWGAQGAARPAEVIDALITEVQAFRGAAHQSDDMTIVVLGANADAA
jgi:sigma-B regulation protein RsbU (phosphoserine phosphatase)